MLALRSKVASLGPVRALTPCKRASATLKPATRRTVLSGSASLVSSFARLASRRAIHLHAKTASIAFKRSFSTNLEQNSHVVNETEPKTVEDAMALAMSHWEKLEFDDAIAALEAYMSRPSHSTMLPHIQVLQTAPLYANFALMLVSVARYDEAIKIYQILVDAANTQLFRWDGLVRDTQENMKTMLQGSPELQSAAELVKQIALNRFELEAALLGYNHDLGISQFRANDHLAAQESFTRALDLLDRQPVRREDLSALIHSSLSLVYEFLGNYKVAAPHHARSLRLDSTQEKFDHPHLATMLHATHFLKDSRAERLKLEAILDNSDPTWRNTRIENRTKDDILNEMMQKVHDQSTNPNGPQSNEPALLTSESQSSVSTEELKDKEDPDNQSTAALLSSPALVEIAQSQAREESKLVEALLEQHKKRIGNDSIGLLSLLLQLATLKRRYGSFDESIKFVEEAIQIVSEAKGKTHALYATTLMHKSLHFHSTGDLVMAEVVAREAFTIREEILGSDHLHVGLAAFDLATLLGKRSIGKESMSYLAICSDIFKKHLFEDHPYYQAVRKSLDVGKQLVSKQSMEEARKKVSGQGAPPTEQ